MTLYKDKYRIETTRLAGWDYSSDGYYFVTVCTEDRKSILGDMVDGEVQLSEIGKIVEEEWQKTPTIRENVGLDEWIIMPNHLHGIIIIENKKVSGNVETTRRAVSTLGSIMGQFKSISTKRIHRLGYIDFAWQSRFYEHIIRNGKSLQKIREYITNNPIKWELDEYNPDRF